MVQVTVPPGGIVIELGPKAELLIVTWSVETVLSFEVVGVDEFDVAVLLEQLAPKNATAKIAAEATNNIFLIFSILSIYTISKDKDTIYQLRLSLSKYLIG